MADAYTTTICGSAAEAQTVIGATASGKLETVVAFMEAGKQKFMVVRAA